MGILRASGLAIAALVGLTAPARAASLDFLHIEANEGGSSGGHVALRFGDDTYHFQNVDGLLWLARETSQRFLHDYALLENRPIHVYRLDVTAAAARAARERFQARLEVQRSQQDALADARRTRALLALLRARRDGEEGVAPDGLAVPGGGYFEAAGSGQPADLALAELRARALRERGEGFFDRRRAELRAALAELAPDEGPGASEPLSLDEPVPYRYGFAARYSDLAAGLVALDVLENARPIRAEMLRTADEPALRLARDEERALRAFGERLRASALRLLEGSRPDWGPALLVSIARLAALEASLRDGRLRVLDAYADDAPTLDRHVLARRRALLPEVAAESRAVLRAALRSFVARRGSEPAWADVEDAANRHLELLGAWREGRSLRAQPERLVPVRRAWIRPPEGLRASGHEIGRALERARQRERRLEREVAHLRGYHLIAHNCVSELFATLNAAFAGPPGASDALGGEIDGRSRLAFIPFVSAGRVAEHYRVQQGFTIPSLRSARLARMRSAERGPWAWLRESSPLTSRAVRPGARDSFFLFFTDGVVWARPILGAFNLAAGAGEAAVGLLQAPLDRGDTLLRGLRGALMSLPELAFVNLRKGTNDWVPREAWRELGVDSGWIDPAPGAFTSAAPVR